MMGWGDLLAWTTIMIPALVLVLMAIAGVAALIV